MQMLEKKRPKEEKDIVQRLKPLAKLQTSEDYDAFVDGILCEASHCFQSFLSPLMLAQGNQCCGNEYKSSNTTEGWAYGRRPTSTDTKQTSPSG